MSRLPDIPGLKAVSMRDQLDAIRRQYEPGYWRSEEAHLDAASLWGIEPHRVDKVIRSSGTFRNVEAEELASAGRAYARAILAHAPNGLWLMTTDCTTPMQGYGSAPSIWSDYGYHSRDDARLMAVYVTQVWFQAIADSASHSHTEAEREQARRVVALLEAEKTPQLCLF